MIHRKKTPIYVYFISFLSIVVVAVCTTVVLSVLSRKPKVPSVTPKSMIYFGTVCTLNLFEDGTQALYNTLFNRLEQIETEFDPARASSDISQINAAAGDHAIPVNSDITYVLRRALAYAELSGGLFDPTIGSITKLWQIGTEEAHIPNQRYIKSTLELVDYHSVVIDGDTVFLEKKGMSLDLGALVKGFAADELRKILAAHHVSKAIIDLGGNIYVFGKKLDDEPWYVGIKNPENESGDPALVMQLDECSVVTSGVYERYFVQGGKRYHHIFNAKTGYPLETNLLSATIICKSSIDADALSTLVFLLGKDDGIDLISRMDGVACVFIDDNLEVTASESLKGNIDSPIYKYKIFHFK